MNAEVIKAMTGKETKREKFSKWWNKNGYKVMRVVFFPLWISIKGIEKFTDYLPSRHKWSEARAKKILNYYIPRVSDWSAKDKSFYFFDNGMGWSINRKKIKFRDKGWWNVFRGFSGGSIRDYLIKDFELEGFEKIINNDYTYVTDITFKMIEK